MQTYRILATFFLLMATKLTPAFAQMVTPSSPSDPHAYHAVTGGAHNESTAAYEAANQKMHQNMSITFTGDADKDFINGMIPHHQGAIDMAQVVLKHGKNPKLGKLEKEIIKAQTKEIKYMENLIKEMNSAK